VFSAKVMKSVHTSRLNFNGFYSSNIHLFYSSPSHNMLVLNTSKHVRCYCAHHTGTDLHLPLIRFTVFANVISSTTCVTLHKSSTPLRVFLYTKPQLTLPLILWNIQCVEDCLIRNIQI